MDSVCCHALMGAICGDIIGLPYEFNGTRTKDFNFDMKLDDFSDDTILSIAIAQWVMGNERTEVALRQLLLDYARRFKHKNVWGRGFMQWVESDGTMDRSGVKSNGAVMRVAAIGYASDSLREVRRLADISARVSHNSDEASMAAQAVASAILLTRKGLSKDAIMNYVMNWYGYESYATNILRQPETIRQNYQFEIECRKCVPEALPAGTTPHLTRRPSETPSRWEAMPTHWQPSPAHWLLPHQAWPFLLTSLSVASVCCPTILGRRWHVSPHRKNGAPHLPTPTAHSPTWD